MTRRHITLENMTEVASNSGVSERKGWRVEMHKKFVSREYSQETYGKLGRAMYEINTESFVYIHWGTPILEITRIGNLMTGYETSYEILHGESKSDSDAINAMLGYFGIDDVRTTFRPVNGGFIILDN